MLAERALKVAVGFTPTVNRWQDVRRVATIDHFASSQTSNFKRRYATDGTQKFIRGLKPTAAIRGRYATNLADGAEASFSTTIHRFPALTCLASADTLFRPTN